MRLCREPYKLARLKKGLLCLTVALLAGCTTDLVAAADRASSAVDCVSQKSGAATYDICTIAAAGIPALEVFWLDGAGTVWGDMPTLSAALAEKGRRLVFATNAGIFQADKTLTPRGLLVAKGQVLHGIELADTDERGNKGNFYDKPNGIFWTAVGKAHITDTSEFERLKPTADIATQSGPLLVLNRKLRNGIDRMRGSHFSRNAVCIAEDKQTRFVLTRDAITMADFGIYLRDGLNCVDALYLDGCGSILHAVDLGRSDKGNCLRGGQLAKAGAILGIAVDSKTLERGKPP